MASILAQAGDASLFDADYAVIEEDTAFTGCAAYEGAAQRVKFAQLDQVPPGGRDVARRAAAPPFSLDCSVGMS
jgi:hypothetical protein